MQKNIKLLALDFDGTVLNSRKEFPKETLEAIIELRRRGIYVVAASGRGIAEMRDYEKELSHFSHGILVSGGLVYDFQQKKPLSQQCLELDAALQVIQFGLEERAMVHILTTYESAVQAEDLKDMSQFQMGIYQDMYNRVSTPVEDIAAFAKEHADNIGKVNLYHRSPESRERTRAKLEDLRLTVDDAETTSLEFSSLGISKAYGLKWMSEKLGLSISETAAIGDAPNDLEILKTAGLSIAMGNADEEIKSICNTVTLNNDENGVLAAINKYIL